MTWSDFNDNRGFQILDTDTMTFEYIKNPNRVFKKLSFDSSKVSKKIIDELNYSPLKGCCIKVKVIDTSNVSLFNDFMTNIEASGPFSVLLSHAASPGDIDILEGVSECLDTTALVCASVDGEDLPITVDRDDLRRLMLNLVKEAENISFSQ